MDVKLDDRAMGGCSYAHWMRPALSLMFAILVLISGQWASADAPIPSQENGNGLVIIDAQTFTPNLSGGLQQSVAMSDADLIALKPAYASGVWADGTSVLVIRLEPFNLPTGAITFSIAPGPGAGVNQAVESTADRIGSLWEIMPQLPAPDAANFGSTSVTLPANGQPVVFYRPPNDFLLGGGQAKMLVKVTAALNGKIVASGSFDLLPPTVIMVHGFGSSPSTWGGHQPGAFSGMVAAINNDCPGIGIARVDYSGEATSGIDEVAGNIPFWITKEVDAARNAGVAATRPDLVVHSYGGILSAWYAANMGLVVINRKDGFLPGLWNGAKDQFIRAENYGRGDIRRLITIGTPFNGSPIAGAVETAMTAANIESQLNFHGFAGDGEAVDDLMSNGSAISVIEQKQPAVAWLPIVCTAGQNPPALQGAWGLLAGWAGRLLNMNPVLSDMVVFSTSQEDVAGTPATSSVPVVGVIHTGETTDAGVELQVGTELDLKLPFNPPAGTVGHAASFNAKI